MKFTWPHGMAAFLLLFAALPNVANAEDDVLTLLSPNYSQQQTDTVIETDCHFATLRWRSDNAFCQPFNILQLSDAGDTVLQALTNHNTFSVSLDQWAHSTVTVTDVRGHKIVARLHQTEEGLIWWPLFVVMAALGVGGFFLWGYIRKQKAKLEAAQKELQDASTRHTRKYDFATVLFADIQGFTKIAAHMNPDQLVDELDRYFIYFDELVDKYSVEKIKTIGDCYMCAGGVPETDSANPIEVTLVGLEMIAYVNERRATEEGFWNIRVGINTGPVISGQLGNIKRVFDIWGDSVNTASRMESGGEPGRVNVSGSTYQSIRDFFECEYRGKMPVKYKGEVDMYFVNRLKEEFCQPGTTFRPNAVLMRRLQLLRLADFETKVRDTTLRGVHTNVTKRFNDFVARIRTLNAMENLADDDAVTTSVAGIFCFVNEEFPKDSTILPRSAAKELMRHMHLSDAVQEKIHRVVSHFTQMRQPENLAEEVILDAFNEIYGRKDIVPLLLAHYEDVVARGSAMSRTAWFSRQRQKVADFVFYTESAKRLCEVPKSKQIDLLDVAMTM